MVAQTPPTDMKEWMRWVVKQIAQLQRRAGGGGGGAGSAWFTGELKHFAGPAANIPDGFLLCNGDAVSRSTYANLFNLIGTTYGVGNGSTTFNLPNYKGRVLVHLDSAQTEFDALGETGGAKTVTLTTAQIPAHGHQQRMTTSNVAPGGGSAVGGMTISGGTIPGTPVEQTTVDAGGGGAHPNLQPYAVVNIIIAY